MADMAKRIKLEHVITARITKQEREEIERVLTGRESLGDFVRDAIEREIARRKRAAKKSSHSA